MVLKEFNISEAVDLFREGKLTQHLVKSFFSVFEMLWGQLIQTSFSATLISASNVITLIEGGAATTSGCALSTITGIPLIRLHGNNGPLDQCEKAIQMSAGYKDYAYATLDILKIYEWKNIVLVYEGKFGQFHGFNMVILQLLSVLYK